MTKKLKDISKIQSGLFARPDKNAVGLYIQPRYIDHSAELNYDVLPSVNLDDVKNKHLLQQDDLLFVARGARNITTLYQAQKSNAAASTSFFVIRLIDNNLLPRYLKWYLNQGTALRQIQKLARGTAIRAIPRGALADLNIPIPSLEAQHKIVAIDQLQKQETELKDQIAQLKELQRQNIILKAIKK